LGKTNCGRIHTINSVAIFMYIWFLWGFSNGPNTITGKLFRNTITMHNFNNTESICILNKNECDLIIHKYKANKIYINYKLPIQKCDYFRYFLMYTKGGFYSDFDVVSNVCFKNLCSMYPHGQIFLCTECVLTDAEVESTKNYKIRNGVPELTVRVGSYWFGSLNPKHKFWKSVLKLCDKRSSLEIQDPYDVIYTTGPDMLTTAYHDYIQKNDHTDIILLDHTFSQNSLRHTCNSLSTDNRESWRSTCKS
jgi:mannosyltransferase OCH1-like enzyme